jgi:molybdenum cofactor cytidylyltransferase
VTGGAQAEVKEALAGFPVRLVHNALYEKDEMLTSFQCGLRAMGDDCGAVLVCLGDQPQIENSVVLRILDLYRQTESGLIIPSFQMRRGHPWLLARTYWEEVLSMGSDQSLRDFLNRHQSEIQYLAVDTPAVLMDLDTPEDYRASSPGMTDS